MAAMFPLRRPRRDLDLTQQRPMVGDAGKGEPEKLGGGGIVRDESGFRGMFGSKRLPRTLGVIGAGLRQIGGEAPDAVNEFVAAERAAQDEQMQRDMFGLRMRSQKAETQQTQDREQLVQEFIASLPAEQQLRARAAYLTDPVGFASQYLGGGEWTVGAGYTHAFRQNGGQVELGDPLPLRPRQPLIQYGNAGDEADWEYGE